MAVNEDAPVAAVFVFSSAVRFYAELFAVFKIGLIKIPFAVSEAIHNVYNRRMLIPAYRANQGRTLTVAH